MSCEAPCSAEVKAMLQGTRIGGVGGDDKKYVGWVKKELGHQLWEFNGVLLDDGEEEGSADLKSDHSLIMFVRGFKSGLRSPDIPDEAVIKQAT